MCVTCCVTPGEVSVVREVLVMDGLLRCGRLEVPGAGYHSRILEKFPDGGVVAG